MEKTESSQNLLDEKSLSKQNLLEDNDRDENILISGLFLCQKEIIFRIDFEI